MWNWQISLPLMPLSCVCIAMLRCTHVAKGILAGDHMRPAYSVIGWLRNGSQEGGYMSKVDQICENYVGVACVDGSCPIANMDTYAEYGADVIRRCEDCWMRKGCEDCALYGSDLCPSLLDDIKDCEFFRDNGNDFGCTLGSPCPHN